MHLPNALSLLMGALLTGSAMAGHPHKHPHQEDFYAITHAIEAIGEATEKLGSTVSQLPMNILRGAIVQTESWNVAKKINKGIRVAKRSQPLNMTMAFHVLVATQDLVGTVNKTMEAVIKAHSDFQSLPVVPLLPMVPHMDAIVLKNLKRQKQLSSQFGDTVLAKVPANGRKDGKNRLDKIARSFEQAIAVYENSRAVAEAATIEDADEEEVADQKIAVPFTA